MMVCKQCEELEALIRVKDEAISFFVNQKGFPFCDFANIAEIDLKEAANGFHKAQQALSISPSAALKQVRLEAVREFVEKIQFELVKPWGVIHVENIESSSDVVADRRNTFKIMEAELKRMEEE